jgi:dipeptidyl-peptidase-3
LKEHIYASAPEDSLFIGKRSEGHISNYYIGEIISDDEVAAVQTAAEKLGIDVLNTRYVVACMTMAHRLKLYHCQGGEKFRQ